MTVRGACLAVTATVTVVAASGCSTPTEQGAPLPPAASTAGLRLTQPRAVHRATRLLDGSVLITGGCTEPGCGGFAAGTRSELYDPGSGLTAGPAMITPRASGTATLLEDGRVLLTGGYPDEGEAPTARAEVYDPRRQTFVPVADLTTARADQTASLLPDGRVVVAGGFDSVGSALATTEIFDPVTATFAPGPDLSAPRAAHVATTVGDAVVLVGGTRSTRALGTVDVLHDGAWQPGPRLSTPRVKLGVAPIGEDRLLVVGGAADVEGHGRLATTEILDLGRAAVERGPRLDRGEYKLDGAIAVLEDGRVVLPAGNGLEVFDPRTTRLTALTAVTTSDATSFRTMTSLGDGRILLAGGYDDTITPTDDASVVRIPSRSRAQSQPLRRASRAASVLFRVAVLPMASER